MRFELRDLTNMKANHGNFLAILGLVSEYDKIVPSRLKGLEGKDSKNPTKAKYTYSIQNELIHTGADIILETTCMPAPDCLSSQSNTSSTIGSPRLLC